MFKIDEIEIKKAFDILKTENKIEYLYNKSYKLVYGIVFSIVKNREETEDIVQKVFIKIYETDKNKLPTNKETCWLYSLTRNLTIDVLRQKRELENIDEYEIQDNNNEIEKLLDIEQYNNMISGLDDKEKEIVSLKVLSNLSFDEISKLLNLPSGTIKWKYYKAINSLKISLSSLALSILAFVISIFSRSKNNTNNYIPFTPSRDGSIESVIPTPNNTYEISTFKIALISIGVLFLIICIVFLIFFIKYQLKQKAKSSK